MAPLNGRKTLAIFLVSFGAVFAVNGYMIARAVNTYTGEDADDAYVQGADFNRTLHRRAEQATLGWTAVIGAQRAQNGELRVLVAVKDRHGRPMAQLGVAGSLKHPSDANRDRRFALRESQAGTYTATLRNVTAGAWDLIVAARGHPFEATRRIWLR